MLCLSRKVGERIRIGPDIEVVIIQVRDGRVKIGIEALESGKHVIVETRRCQGRIDQHLWRNSPV